MKGHWYTKARDRGSIPCRLYFSSRSEQQVSRVRERIKIRALLPAIFLAIFMLYGVPGCSLSQAAFESNEVSLLPLVRIRIAESNKRNSHGALALT